MVVLMRVLAGVFIFSFALAQDTPAPPKPDKVISIAAERFTFNPSKINLRQGQVVEFVVTSDDTDHGFRIPSAGIDVAIPPSNRGEARVRFVAKEKGTFIFECSRPCGAGHNLMRGTIVVK